MRKVAGAGINDLNIPVYIKGKKIKSYETWQSMLIRCFYRYYKTETYIGCSISKEWLYFSNFKRWFDENYIEGYHLDKDLLKKGNKLYSADTCCFIPQEINKLLTIRKKCRGKYPIGVSQEKKTKMFIASMTQHGKHRYFGLFKTIEEAFHKYKIEKEEYMKAVADKYFSKGLITSKVRDAIFNYKIEITD